MSAPDAYRKPVESGTSGEAPRELVYAPDGETVHRGVLTLGRVGIIFLGALPVAAIASMIWSDYAALVVFALAAFVAWKAQRAWSRVETGAVRFRVEHGRLDVSRVAGHEKLVDVPLEAVEDVTLDTKTVQTSLEGGSMVAAVRVSDRIAGPEVDKARILLVTAGGAVRLSEEFGSHTAASEALGRIRGFLRKHGWVPADEREAGE